MLSDYRANSISLYPIARRLGYLTVGLFVISWLLPAVDPLRMGDSKPMIGFVLLVMGWLFPPAWAANWVLLFGLNCLIRCRFQAAAMLGTSANLLALTTLTVCKPSELYVGYYVWQASHLVFAVGTFVLAWRTRVAIRQTPSQPQYKHVKAA